jgi:rare lipoprotein A
MMGRAGVACFGGIARIGVLVCAGVALAACAAANKASTRNSNYSKRIVEDGEAVPKGGGNYKVGQPYQLNGQTYYPVENPQYRAEGIASWYGPDFHGRETANGEAYDMHAISAAHPTLPMPSYLRVTNLGNGRSIIVRLNDRGPYTKNRIIDVSIGAAKALDFYGHGLARVRVEYVGRAPLEGSDPKMLLATLRHGSPAPAPSLVMLASAKPYLPQPGGGSDTATARGREGVAPIPAGRPFTLGAGSVQPATQPTGGTSGDRRARSVVQLPAAVEQVSATPTGPGSMPIQSLGLLSGRGLY